MGFLIPLTVLSVTGQTLASDPPSAGAKASGPRLTLIKPGTVIDRKPPASWNHLVIKSLPHLTSGDLQTLPRSAFRTATLFRTVILADVGPSRDNPQTFRLNRLGIGLCVPNRNGRDVVVHSGRLEESGVSLGMMEKMVLKSAEAELLRGRLIAATPTFALYRAPAVLEWVHAHRKVMIYYAFLVEPQSGELRTFVWAEDAQRPRGTTSTEVVELEPGLVYDCGVNVLAERLLGAVPVSWSFAMESLPPGRVRTVPLNLAQARQAGGGAAVDSRIMEREIRQSLTGSQG
jgi:hypothetical protein